MVKNGDPSHGKQLFVEKCASCHTLADAHTSGTVGPNLDDAFSSDKQQGFAIQSMEDLVRGQIAYPEPPMPANLVNGQDANDVATYVAKCAGNPACGVTASRSAPPPTSTATGTSPTTTSATTTTSGSSALAAGKQVFASAG